MLRSVLRWAASAVLVLAALVAVIASFVIQFGYGSLVEPPRPASLSVMILFVLPIALVGGSVYLASAWLYRGDRQFDWLLHLQHTWLLYGLIALAAYSLGRCGIHCDPDSAAVYRVLCLGAIGAVVADLLAYFRHRRVAVRAQAA